MNTLFILTLYGASGIYKSRPLTATELWNWICDIENSGVHYSTEKAP